MSPSTLKVYAVLTWNELFRQLVVIERRWRHAPGVWMAFRTRHSALSGKHLGLELSPIVLYQRRIVALR